MLELTYSNRTEALLERLTERVRAQRATGKGPWETIHVVVPNPYLKEYLRLGLARSLGVAANIQFSYLAGLWKDLLGEESRTLLDFDLLRSGLLSVLGDRAFLAQEGLQPVRDYLDGEGNGLKRVQLAGELARVFEEYQLSRPDWIEAWRAGKGGQGPDPAQDAWQARLWLETVRRLQAAAPAGQPVAYLTLLERVRQARLQGLKLPRAIHAFGLSHVAQAYQEIYRAFGSLPDTTLHIYALNPCGEFWEDLSTDRKALWTSLPHRQEARLGAWDEETEDFYGLASQGPRALRLWGRPGRENIRLLNEVSDCDFVSAFEMPLQPTLLGQMQRDILLYQEPGEGEGAGPDGSIRCLAAASQRREAEIVATEIWSLMARHGATERPLHFSEIAVVVPPGDQEAYRAHLEAAFHDAHRIPMVQSDRALPIMRQTLEAVQRLLELPTSGLTRAALLGVLQHPGLQRRFPNLDVSAWGRWCEELGIVRGADQAAWADTYLDRDALNWDQGLKRLALGAFMTEDTEFQSGGETYRVNGARAELPAATFTALVRGLSADAQELLQGHAEPRAWIRLLWNYLERWLQVDEGEEAESVLKALDRIRTFLERMFETVPEALELPRMGFPAARHLAQEALARLQDEQPANLSKGVVIATYATMRAIPFRALFLMGAGEGSFPTRNHRSALDLRTKGRRPGDVNQTEKEKYLFLEMLLSAREHLAISYVALDELSGEAFEPSGLYKEFRALAGDYLAPCWAPTERGDPFLEVHPLRRFDPAYFPQWFEAGAPVEGGLRSHSTLAEAEARALWLGREALGHHVTLPLCLGDLHLEAAALARLREALAAPPIPEAVPGHPLIRITLNELKTFLECPLSGAAGVRLGLRKGPVEDRGAVENEIFESEFLESWSLQREVALGACRDGASAVAVYDRCLRRLQAEGSAPFGVFSEVEKQRDLGPIDAWVQYLGQGAAEGGPATWRLGANRSRTDQVDHPCPPLALTITLQGEPRRVELSGDLRVQWQGSLFLEEGKPPSASAMDKVRRKALGAYIDHLVLACVDPGHGEHRARFVYTASVKARGQETHLPFPSLSREEAEAQLGAWIEDLLTDDPAVLMPIEAVLKHWPAQTLTGETILAYVEEQLEKKKGEAHFSTLDGPVPEPLRYAPPRDPLALTERRLGAYLKAIFPPQAQEQS